LKISISGRGKFRSEETRANISAGLKRAFAARGSMPEEIRNKIRQALTGRKIAPEIVEKVRLAVRGKKRTAEQKVNYSISAKAAWAKRKAKQL
jgi:hypothetical protein